MLPPPSDNVKSSPSDSKENLREIARANLTALTLEERKTHSALIAQKLADHLAHHHGEARRIATFSSLPHEPNLSLLNALLPERQFHYPLVLSQRAMSFHLVTDPTTLQRGAFGIQEPNPQMHPPVLAADLDLILIPGLAFDPQGNRLGHGKGYYDCFLKEIPAIPTIGIGYSTQLFPQVPNEPHDKPMAFLATEHGVVPA